MKHNAATLLGLLTLALMLLALFMVFAWVPTEAEQGVVQRIFYFHVACAWVSFAAFGLVAICGIFYLWLKQEIFDELGYTAAEVGMVFCTLVLITGSIWAKPIWGTWWTWDSRLTTTLILWLLYGGYLILRAMGGATPETARFAAVVGIAAAADVPVVIVSVRLWRTIHPAVLVTREGGHGLQDPRMVVALLVSLAAFTALVIWLMMLRIGLVRADARLRGLAREVGLAQAALQDL
jgi:heme exporter protein C